jgi:hypothetical protein
LILRFLVDGGCAWLWVVLLAWVWAWLDAVVACW